MATLTAMRWNIGTDYPMYSRFYEMHIVPGEYTNNIESIPQEAGYVWLSTLAKGVGLSAQVFIGLFGLVTIAIFFIGMRRVSPNIGLSLLLLILLCFYTGTYNYIRQGFAMALVFSAFAGANRRVASQIPLILLASLFHTTALIAGLILLCLDHLKGVSRKVLIWATITSIGAALALKSPVTISILDAINPRYSVYLSSSGEGFGTLFIALSRILCLALIFYLVRYDEMSFILRKYTLFSFAGLLILFVANSMSVLVRFEYYFGVFLVLAVPLAISETKRRKSIAVLAIASLFVYFILHILQFDNVYPYKSFLQPGVA